MPPWARWLLVVALSGGAACDKGAPLEDAVARPSASPVPSDGPVEVESLGLSFELTGSFETSEGPGFELLAKSLQHHSVLSIANDQPDVVEAFEPERGESVAPADIPGVDAVVVTDAVLEGLQPGLEARELLVANGDRSFTLIFSAREADLPELWEGVMDSLSIEPD